MSRTIIFTVAGAVILAAGAAQASGLDPRPAAGGLLLKAADANDDNIITEAELSALQEEMFAWRDRNGDQVLSLEDRSPIAQRLVAKREAMGGSDWDRAGLPDPDADGDGAVSWEEYQQHHSARFAEIDANGDGQLTLEEARDAAPDGRHRRFRR